MATNPPAGPAPDPQKRLHRDTPCKNCGHRFDRHTTEPDIEINYLMCCDCEGCNGFSVGEAALTAVRAQLENVTGIARTLEAEVRSFQAQRDQALAALTALRSERDELQQQNESWAVDCETLGRWNQCGLTLMKFFPTACVESEAALPDFLWEQVPTLIRQLRAELAEARARLAVPPTAEDCLPKP